MFVYILTNGVYSFLEKEKRKRRRRIGTLLFVKTNKGFVSLLGKFRITTYKRSIYQEMKSSNSLDKIIEKGKLLPFEIMQPN